MTMLRMAVVVALLLGTAAVPYLFDQAGPLTPDREALASPLTGVLAQDDDDDGDDDNEDDDNEDDEDDNEDDGDDDNDNGDDEDEDEDGGAPPPPPAAPAAAPAAAPPPPSEVSACLSGDQQVVLQLSGGNARVRVPGQSVQVTLRAVDPGAVPAPPGTMVDALVFEVIASSCGGGQLGQFPEAVNVGVDYLPESAAGLNQANFRIAVLQGGVWSPSAAQAADPGNSYVSATETRVGTYVVYQS